MTEIICKLTLSFGKVRAIDQEIDTKTGRVLQTLELATVGKTLEEILEDDKRYGLLTPKDGKSYAYFIKNKDIELTNKQVRKAVTKGLLRWYFDLDFEFHRAIIEQNADLVFEFRSEEEDPILNPQTLAYMYYPVSGAQSGHCVINTRPFFTLHGNGIDMHYIDPAHYPELGSGVEGATIDLDQVLGHELGHGLLGLPHATGLMSPNYSFMTEFVSDLDIIRGSQKIPKRNWLARKYKRLKEWFLKSSER